MRSVTAILRRLAVVAVGTSLLVWAAALPASADTPEGWATEPTVGFWHFVLVLGVLPLAALLVITVLVLAPSLARGEPLRPGPRTVDDQWLGGPRRSVDELAAPDSDGSKAGGASGRW